SGRENLLELIGAGGLELVVAARRRRPVRAPAQKSGRVPEAVALQVIVFHLAHALDAQRLPRQVLARAPPALPAGHALRSALGGLRPPAPRMPLERVLAQRLELLRELLARGHGEGRRHADVMQRPLVVVETEEQRAHCILAALVPAKARD